MDSTEQPRFDFASPPKPDTVPADQHIRERVIHTLDRPLVVEAGAGTGKTTLLVSRLLHAIEIDAVRMQQIVAISFTEKAAAELRLRLRQALEKRCAAVDVSDPCSVALQRALQELHQARISTIHSFAASILREHPVEAQLDPQFRTLDELESLQLQRSFWKRWVDEELEGAEAERLLLPALQAGVRLSPDLEILGRALYDNRDLQSSLSYPSIPAEVDAWMQRFREEMLKCVQHGEDNCREPEDKGLVHLRDVRRRLETLEDLQPSSWPAVFLGELNVYPTRGKREFWRGDSGSANKAQRKSLQEALTKIQQHLANRVLRGSLQWLQRWLAAYDAEKRRMGVVDFQDLLVQAQQLVRNDLAVRVELGRHIGMLCIDEFQDTDPLQAQLAMFLAEEGRPAPEWDSVMLGAKLFLVGDPKQSIYRFRRADLEIYQRCCELVRKSGGEVLDIVQNFRSRPAILHWTNAVFDALFAGNDGSSSEPRQVPLVPLADSSIHKPAVWIVQPGTPSRATAGQRDAARQDEAAAIVRMIQKARREEWPVRTPLGLRALQASDIAILFGRTSGIELYEDALRQAGVPFRQEGGKLFFQRQEVRDILHALAACDDPHDEWSIVAALRSPLFGASDEDLYRHRTRFRAFRYSENTDGSPLEEALSVLRSLHQQRHRLGIAGCVEALLARTAARAVYAVQPQGSRALSNFEMLTRQARVFESSGDQGLREFVRSLRELEDETPRLAEWAPEEESGEHVRLITVHMAKGLEFPFVVLANLNAGGNTRSEPLLFDRSRNRAEAKLSAADLPLSLKTAGFQEVAEQERVKGTAEEKRLLYVAATRARDYLVVGNFAGDKVAGYLKPLRSVTGALGGGQFGELRAPVLVTAEPGSQGDVERADWCVIDSHVLTASPAPAAPVRRREQARTWLAGRSPWVLQHAAHLKTGSQVGGRVSPAAILVRGREGDALEAARLDESRLGWVTHAILEEWTPGMPEAVRHAMAFEICDRFHSSDLQPAVLELMRSAESVPELRTWLGVASRIRRAVPMQAHVGQRLVSCVQDLLLETTAGVVLIDFTIRSHAQMDAQAEQNAQALRGALLVHSGQELACVGTIFLVDSVWSELEAAPQQAKAFLERLGDLGENQPRT